MRTRLLPLLLCILAVFGPIDARSDSRICPGADLTQIRTGSPELRVIFISFPAHAGSAPCCECDDPGDNDLVPPWADDFATRFTEYMAWVSHGQYTPHVEVIHHVDPSLSGQNWRAANPSTVYSANACGLGQSPNYGHLNAEIIEAISDEYAAQSQPNPWDGVDGLMIFNFEKVWPNTTFLGVGNLGLPASFDGSQFGFYVEAGATMMLGCWEIDDATVPPRVERGAAHEFGHVLHLGHAPNTSDIDTNPAPEILTECGEPAMSPEYVNMGRYSIMKQAHAEGAGEPGYVAYHPMQIGADLAPGSTEWVPVSIAAPTPCYTTYRVPDIRDPSAGAILKVPVPGSDQFFLLVNHQGDGYDDKYGGAGLLIWHIKPGIYWDLESAAGKTNPPPGMSGPPDPDTWWDDMEADVCNYGAAGNFFDGSPGRNAFNPTTNPNSNLYGGSYQVQDLPSGIHIDNIRYDPGTTDILVDIASSNFGVESPLAGARFAAGEVIDVAWSICGTTVDVLVSDETGANSSFQLLEDDGPNDGSYSFTVPAGIDPGDAYKLRVIPDNSPNFSADSEPFTIWAITSHSVVQDQDCSGHLLLEIDWETSEASFGNDMVFALAPDQTYSYAQWFSSATTHEGSLVLDCQPGTWMCYLNSNYSETGASPWSTSVSVGVPVVVSECTTCPPPGGNCTKNCPTESDLDLGVDSAHPVTAVRATTPNPFATGVAIHFTTADPSDPVIRIFDARGRIIRSETLAHHSAGAWQWTWDGRSDAGSQVASGVFYVQLRAGRVTDTLRMVKVER